MRWAIRSSAWCVACVALCCCQDDATKERAPKVYFGSSGQYEIAPGDTLVLEPKILYDSDSEYTWQDDEGNVLSNERDLVFVTDAMRDYRLTFMVSTPAGADTFGVDVSVQLCATFSELENYSTKKSSVLALMPDTLEGAFRWKGVEFANMVNSDTSMWYGFAYSNKTSLQSTLTSQSIGTAYASGGTSNGYMAVCAVSTVAQVRFSREYSVKSMDIANDNFVYLASKFGYMTTDSAVVSPASYGDYYRVVVEGIGSDGAVTGSRVSVDLVDCDYDNPAKYVRQTVWKSVDMSSLGVVRGLLFSVETSMGSFPPLFCIDNLRLQD